MNWKLLLFLWHLILQKCKSYCYCHCNVYNFVATWSCKFGSSVICAKLTYFKVNKHKIMIFITNVKLKISNQPLQLRFYKQINTSQQSRDVILKSIRLTFFPKLHIFHHLKASYTSCTSIWTQPFFLVDRLGKGKEL